MNREKEIRQPKPFGVEYIPHKKRMRAKSGEFVLVGLKSDIPAGKAKAFHFEKFKVAVFHVDGHFYAIKDACPHAEYPLNKGTIEGEVVTCSSHSWKFNVRTGECVRAEHDVDCKSVTVRIFPVEIRGDEIWVKV